MQFIFQKTDNYLFFWYLIEIKEIKKIKGIFTQFCHGQISNFPVHVSGKRKPLWIKPEIRHATVWCRF